MQRVWNKKLFNKDYIRNDVVDVDIYSSAFPISYNGKVSNTRLDIKNLQNAIKINFSGVKTAEDKPIQNSVCSYYNEDKQVWTMLECQKTINQCCTTHLTAFALIDSSYFEMRAKYDRMHIGVSMVPLILIAFLLIWSIYHARKTLNA